MTESKILHFSRGYDPLINLFPSDFIDVSKIKDFIPFGEDNLLPQQINELSRTVTIHRAIINSKSDYLSGTGFSSPNQNLENYISKVNNFEETFHQVFSKVIFDDIQFGNAYFELITDHKRSYIQFYHVDASSCRISADTPAFVIIHPNWRQYEGINDKFRSVVPLFPNFAKGSDNQYHSIFHIKAYEPEFSTYGLPKWFAGLSSVIIAGLTDQWNRDRLESQFNGDGLLVIPGVNSDTEMELLQTKIDTFTGSANNPNANNLLVQFLSDLGPGKSRDPAQYIPFLPQSESQWIQLHIQAYNNLLAIHNWFKTLCSFYGEKTGFDTHRILNEYEVALNTIIKQFQNRYLNYLTPLLIAFGYDVTDLAFENMPPINKINPVLFVWEVRRDAGLPFDKSDPRQQVFYKELQNKFFTENTLSNEPDN